MTAVERCIPIHGNYASWVRRQNQLALIKELSQLKTTPEYFWVKQGHTWTLLTRRPYPASLRIKYQVLTTTLPQLASLLTLAVILGQTKGNSSRNLKNLPKSQLARNRHRIWGWICVCLANTMLGQTCKPRAGCVGMGETHPARISQVQLFLLLLFLFLLLPCFDLSEAALSSSLKQDLNSLPRNWTWVTWMKTRNPSHQPSKG